MIFSIFKYHRRSGFTLIELLLYMGLFSILLSALVSLFAALVEVQLESETYTPLEQNARYITHRLAYDIQRADTIIMPAALGDTSTILSLTIDGQSYQYAIDQQDLIITRGADTFGLTSYDAQMVSITFTRYGNASGVPVIEVQMTVQSSAVLRGQPESYTYRTMLGNR